MIRIVVAVAAALAAAGAGAADSRFGSPIQPEMAEHTVTITESTRYVNVEKFDTVRFLVRSGEGRDASFAWRFDTFSIPVFDLAEIAPAGMLGKRRVTVYVAPQKVGF